MIYVNLDLIGKLKIDSFDELLNIPEIYQFCITPSFKGFCYNTVNYIDYVLFIEYENPPGCMRIGTFTTVERNLDIPKRD